MRCQNLKAFALSTAPSGYEVKERGVGGGNDSNNPIKWFGGMVSPHLKSAQATFTEGRMSRTITPKEPLKKVVLYLSNWELIAFELECSISVLISGNLI